MQRLFLYVVLAAGLLSCKNKPAAEKTEQTDTTASVLRLDSAQQKNAGITWDTVTRRMVHTTIRANGKVDVPPQSMVSVSFPLGGYLKNTTLLPGANVHRGEVIGVMEDQSYVQLQQDYLTAKARMEYLSADVQRQKELSENNATSQKNYQQVLSEYKMQQVLLKSLEEKLHIIGIQPGKLSVGNISRDVPVYSPITGYVTKVNVNIGKYVNPADVLFELVNPDDIHAAITVFEKDMPSFKPGMKGKVSLADNSNQQYDVEVILVTQNVEDNRTGLVHCHFEHPLHALLPGMFLTGVFELDSQLAYTVPDQAVVRYEGKEYVFLAEGNNTYRLTEVKTGSRENNYVVLKEPAAFSWQGKKVVVNGAYALLGKLKNKMEED